MARGWHRAAAVGAAIALAVGLTWSLRTAGAQAPLDAARKEGKVVWYSSLGLSLAQKVCNAFNKKGLGVTCELNRDGSERIFQKVMQEAQANLAIVDVIHTSDISHFLELSSRDMLAAYEPAGAERFPAEFRDPGRHYTVLRSTPYVIAVNTQKVAAGERPRRWKDLLDPRWKGKLVHAHPGYSGVVTTGMTGLLGAFGWDYYAALAKNDPLIVQSAEDPPMKVAGGEAWVGVSGEYNFYRTILKGNPVETIFPEEGSPFIHSANGIMAKAPHPAAARVFTDYLFSVEGQQILANDGLYVPNPDVTYPKGKRPLKDIKVMPATPADVKKHGEEIKEKFRELFGV